MYWYLAEKKLKLQKKLHHNKMVYFTNVTQILHISSFCHMLHNIYIQLTKGPPKNFVEYSPAGQNKNFKYFHYIYMILT